MAHFMEPWEVVKGMSAARQCGHGCVTQYLEGVRVPRSTGYRWEQELTGTSVSGGTSTRCCEAWARSPCQPPTTHPTRIPFAERWIRGAREECLNHLILFGLKSLQRVVRSYRAFHNDHRPHQGIDNRVPRGTPGEQGLCIPHRPHPTKP